MKQPVPHSKILCCASVFALALSACGHNAGKLKTENLADNSSDNQNRIVKLKKGHRSKKLGLAQLPDPRSYDNLWDRLFDRFDLPEVNHPDVDRELNWFINHPAYIERVQSRAEPFLYSIVKQLEKQNLPGELALLPVIESAFQPHVVSPAHAAGIWQFIPATGHHYGLKYSHSYDGRRDIYASTRAAIKYLKKLRNDFNGDWLLAIAGYNCGEHAVARAVQRNAARGLPTDFWSLSLPQETRSYVPRLLAVARLFSESERYGFELRPIPNQPLYKTVKLNHQIDLAMAANAADISLDRLFELNPGFKRQHVDLDGSYRLFIPAHKKIVDFKEDLARQMAGTQGGDYSRSGPVATDLAASRPATEAAQKTLATALAGAAAVEAQPESPRQPAAAEPASPAEQPPAAAEPRAVETAAAEPTPGPYQAETAAAKPPAAAPYPAEESPAPAESRSADANAYRTERVAEKPPLPDPFAAEAKPLPDENRAAEPAPQAYRADWTQPKAAMAIADGNAGPAPKPARKAADYAPPETALRPPEHERAAQEPPPKIPPKAAQKGRDEPAAEHRGKLAAHEESAPREEPATGRAGHKIAAKGHSEPPPEPDNANKKVPYVVQEGDTAYSIARKHGMDVDELKKMNRLSDADDIKWGESLTVTVVEPPHKETGKKPHAGKGGAAAKAQQPTRYTARGGETLFSISRRFNVTVADLRKWNGIKEDRQFRAGMNITVYSDKD